MKNIFVTFLLTFFCSNIILFSQIQIGQSIVGIEQENTMGACALNGNGNIVIVGSNSNSQNGIDAGMAQVYELNSNQWLLKGQNLYGESSGDLFGANVAVNNFGNIIAISAQQHETLANSMVGYVKIYEFLSNNWIQKGQTLFGINQYDYFGENLALSDDGNTIIIGAQGSGGGNLGYTKVFTFDSNSNTWVQKGNTINGNSTNGTFGNTVDISGNGLIITVGTCNNDNSGYVQVYEWNNNQWEQIGENIVGTANSFSYGYQISLNKNGNTIAISSAESTSPTEFYGTVTVYQNNSSQWVIKGSSIQSNLPNDNFGVDIDLNENGDYLIVGIYASSSNGYFSGNSKLFNFQNNTWAQLGQDIEGENPEDLSGAYVSINNSGSIVSIGEPYNDNNGNASGQVRLFSFENLVATNDINKNEINVYQSLDNCSLIIRGDNIKNIEVYDITGKKIFEKVYLLNTNEIDISYLNNGLYFIRINNSITKPFSKV